MKNLQLDHQKNVDREMKKYNEELKKLEKKNKHNKKNLNNNNRNINNDIYVVEDRNNWREKDSI